MSTKFLIFVVSVWLILVITGMLVEQGFFSGSPQQTATNVLINSRAFGTINDAGEQVGLMPNMAWFSAMGRVATFNFVFFDTGFYPQLVRIIMFLPIGIAVLTTLLLAFIRGTGST